MEALRSIRISNICDEPEIHKKIMTSLEAAGIVYEHEYKLISHKRFDFWISGIVIEVKKVKPPKDRLLIQLDRYTAVPEVRALIVVFRNFQGAMKGLALPDTMNGKPIYLMSLNRNWGIAF
jgi:hypothetical protein